MPEELPQNFKDPKWIHKSSIDTLKKPELVQLHRNFVLQEINNLDFFYKYRFYYSTLLMGILSASIGILLKNLLSPAIIIFVPIPFSIIILAVFAKQSIKRYYRRFLETVIMEAKIENSLGLDDTFLTSSKPLQSPWPNDVRVTIQRYYESRYDTKSLSSEEWKKKRMDKGDCVNAERTFTYFMIIGIIFTLFTIYIGLVNIKIISDYLNITKV